ncbi:hypothetical protein LTR36_008491 [Oleoguttula mirabilis]|uniref:Uncharacterized protein n=1 Tax=Oleoguttula mirabilis TaxID=1507867 RepID=A0AAV9JST1_9PEZI|nr:hypothetical protein LTR36_008491 [Oleoguttula mirabilis]
MRYVIAQNATRDGQDNPWKENGYLRYRFEFAGFTCDNITLATQSVIPWPDLPDAASQDLNCWADPSDDGIWWVDVSTYNGPSDAVGKTFLACAMSWLYNPFALFEITDGSCTYCDDLNLISKRQDGDTNPAAECTTTRERESLPG